jgi:hypothetical protein
LKDLQVLVYKKVEIVSQTKYMTKQPSENNVSAWKEYMKWTLLNGSLVCCRTVDAANFDFTERHSSTIKRPLRTELCKQLMAPSVKRLNYMLKKVSQKKSGEMIHT